MYSEILTSINQLWDNLAPSLPIAFRQRFEAGKEAVINEIPQLTTAISKVKGNVDLTPEAKKRMINEAFSKARANIDANLEKLMELVQDLKTNLQQQLAPAKPERIDYGELANLKDDLRMVLDALEPRQALDRMAQALEEALTSSDALTVWLLGGSNWPFLYVESRGITNRAEWEDARDKALAKFASEEQFKARNLLQKLEGPSGVQGVISGLRLYVNAALASLQK